MTRGASRVRLRADFPRRGATIYGTMYSASKLHDALVKRILISLSLSRRSRFLTVAGGISSAAIRKRRNDGSGTTVCRASGAASSHR